MIIILHRSCKLRRSVTYSYLGDRVGKYERGGAVPSLEVAKNIADAFEVTIDYLVGEGQNSHLDKKNLKRLEELQLLDKGKQNILYDLIDTYIRDAKARLAYS